MDEIALTPGVTGALLVELTPAGVTGDVGHVRYNVRTVGPVPLERATQIVILQTALKLLLAIEESGS